MTNCSSLAPVWSKYLFAITAGGNTLFERICAGVPGLTINQLDRQNGFAQIFEDLHVNINLGLWSDFQFSKFDEAVGLLASMEYPFFTKCDLPLDALGGDRTVKVIVERFNLWKNPF